MKENTPCYFKSVFWLILGNIWKCCWGKSFPIVHECWTTGTQHRLKVCTIPMGAQLLYSRRKIRLRGSKRKNSLYLKLVFWLILGNLWKCCCGKSFPIVHECWTTGTQHTLKVCIIGTQLRYRWHTMCTQYRNRACTMGIQLWYRECTIGTQRRCSQSMCVKHASLLLNATSISAITAYKMFSAII